MTVTGVNLSSAIAVYFGDKPATITANTPTMVTLISPAGTGVVLVKVVTQGGESNGLSFFYIPPPVITELSPTSGPVAGGNTVTISGINLSTATSVTFGSNSATPTVLNDASISVVVPAGSSTGQVPVSVTTTGDTTSALYYGYVDAPTLTSVTPASGPTSGGTSVTLTGTDLSTVTGVTFDGNSAAFTVINSTQVVSYTPAGTAGDVDVVITTTGGSATANDGFSYITGPGI